MIPTDKIIDDSEIKKANKIRDDSFKKFCNDFDYDKIIITKYLIEDPNDSTKQMEIIKKTKLDYVQVKRNEQGEIILWKNYYKSA